jgi:hypothetical protein
MRFRNGRFEYHWLLSVEGEAGDGGNGGGTGSDQQGSGEETGDVSQIPAGLPEKFWDASTNTVRQDDLIGAYNNISSSYTKKQEDIRAEIDGERMANRPADVDGYKFAMPESVQIPDGYEFTLDDTDPILQFWREHSFENGFGQEQFDAGVAAYVNSKIENLPDRAAEIAKLGERGDERYERAASWMTKDMPTELHGPLAEMLKTAEGVTAVEKLMDRGNVPFNLRTNNSADQDAADNPSNKEAFDNKTRSLMAAVGPNTYSTGDKGAVQVVRDRWQASEKGTIEPQRNRGGG